MNNWKVIPTIVLATALIFGAGVFTGGMLVNHVNQSRPHGVKHPLAAQSNAVPTVAVSTNPPAKAAKPLEIRSKDFLQRLDAELRLSKDQHDCIQKIITDNQNLMTKIIQDARLEIREALTPEQRQQFDELMKHPARRALPGLNASAAPAATNAVVAGATNAP